MSWIDVSVFAGNWPFRAHAERTPHQLKGYLSELGITEAWVASASAILYPDPMQGNEPLFAAVGDDPFFVKLAIVDVTLATWERDLVACIEQSGCRGVKLLPGYHQYELGDPRVAVLLDVCARYNLPVCIQVRMMDERGHHPLMKVPGVPVEDIARLAQAAPNVRFLACGVYQGELGRLASTENVWAETSFIESGHALANAVNVMGANRLLFGSHTPLLSFAAGAAKLDAPEGDVEPALLQQIRSENASILLNG